MCILSSKQSSLQSASPRREHHSRPPEPRCRRRTTGPSDAQWRCPGLYSVTFAAAMLTFVAPLAKAFVGPQVQPAGRISVGVRQESGLKILSTRRPLRQRNSQTTDMERNARTRSSLRMAAVGAAQDTDHRRRGDLRSRLGARVRRCGRRMRLAVARQVVSAWLRSAKRAAGKRALTVALAVALTMPSVNIPHLTGDARSAAVGASSAAVEVVVPSDYHATRRATLLTRRRAGSDDAVRSTGSSTRAFVGPWSDGSGQLEGAVATAVRAPTKGGGKKAKCPESGRRGKKAAPDTATSDSTSATMRSLVTTVEENAVEIAEDFGGHIQGAKRDVLVILMANALIIPLCKRVGLSPVLGFLAAGVALGPNCLSVVSDVKAIEVLGEMGIVFFLFEMGLELSVQRLVAMKRDVFGMGLATFGVSAAAVAGLGYMAGLTGAQMIVIGGGVALSSSAFVLQLLRDRDDLGTRYGRACFGILLFQDLAVVPLLVAIPLLAGGGGGIAAALTSAATKAAIALGLIAFIGKNVLDRFFLLVAKSKSQEAFLAVILLTVIALSSITEGLGLSGTLGAFLAGTLLSETKYTPQVEADIAPFRALLLGMFFMTVGFEIDLVLCFNNLSLVASLVSGLLAMKAAVIAIIALAFGLSVANAQQTGLLLSQGGEFAFVAFGMAERLGILDTQLCKLLLTTVAISMAATPALSTFSAWVADQMEGRMGYDHYVGGDSESDEIRKGDEFVVVCGYGRIGRLVCELLGKKFIRFVAFDNNPLKAMEARNRGLPVFYGDVFRPEVLNAFNVGKAKAVICTLSDVKGTNKAVVNLRREFPDLPIFARAKDSKHQKRLSSIMDVVAMVPTLPEDSIIVSLPFGGAVLRSLGCTADEVNVLLEDSRKKFVMEKGLEEEEDDNLFEQLGISRSEVQTYRKKQDAVPSDPVDPETEAAPGDSSEEKTASVLPGDSGDVIVAAAAAAVAAVTSNDTAVPTDDHESDAPDIELSPEALAAAATTIEDEENAAAMAAAAALEAAVASGDVVYPTNPDPEAAVEGEQDDVSDEADAAGEELATSMGSTEVF